MQKHNISVHFYHILQNIHTRHPYDRPCEFDIGCFLGFKYDLCSALNRVMQYAILYQVELYYIS